MSVSRYKKSNLLRFRRRKSLINSNASIGATPRQNYHPTPVLRHPTKRQRAMIRKVAHIWRETDSYWKLSTTFYGDASYWWIIAWYNQAPTESHLHPGERIFIPTNLTDALQILGV